MTTIRDMKSQTIWFDRQEAKVCFIDQTLLPFKLRIAEAHNWESMVGAVAGMKVRGAPLIGVAGAWAAVLALKDSPAPALFEERLRKIEMARPTAVNLHWAVDRIRLALESCPADRRFERAVEEAEEIQRTDSRTNYLIGRHFLGVLREIAAGIGDRPVQILTHCNAGWLATTEYGTALSGIYQAHAEGIPLHVWVDETRPRLQGLLTEWELRQAGIPCTVIADNAGGHLMQERRVDVVVVGADRIAANGDTANKIGTYLKALAAGASKIPFYVAAPMSTVDFELSSGVGRIPIESRSEEELKRIQGLDAAGRETEVCILSALSDVSNPAFDVTPAELITGIVTEKGVFRPEELAGARE